MDTTLIYQYINQYITIAIEITIFYKSWLTSVGLYYHLVENRKLNMCGWPQIWTSTIKPEERGYLQNVNISSDSDVVCSRHFSQCHVLSIFAQLDLSNKNAIVRTLYQVKDGKYFASLNVCLYFVQFLPQLYFWFEWYNLYRIALKLQWLRYLSISTALSLFKNFSRERPVKFTCYK